MNFFHLQLEEATSKAHQAIELARSTGEPFAEAHAHAWAYRAMIQAGDLEGAQEHARTMLTSSEQLHDRERLVLALLFNGESHQLAGDFAMAREYQRRPEISSQDIRHLCHRALLEYQTGNLAEAQQYAERIPEVIPLTVSGPNTGYAIPAITVPVFARICGLTDFLSIGEAAARTVLSSPPVTPWLESTARSGLGLVAVLRQDKVTAGEQYLALEPQRGTMAAVGCLSMDRLLGLLSHTIGNLDQATQHFEDALAFCRRGGYRPELAWSLCDYADMLLERNQGDNHEKAMTLLDESLAISTELGMRPLMERVLSRREKLGA